MKSEIELTPYGDLVEMTFTYCFCKAEPDVGYMDDYCDPLPEVDGSDLEVTDHIRAQLTDAAMSDMENVPERVTRACDIKDSILAPFFETLGQDINKLTIKGDD